MKREFVISLVFHVVLVSAAIVSSPFEPQNKIDYGQVIRVSLPSASQIPEIKPPAPTPVEIPKALAEIEPDIPIDAPTTKPAVKIEKPKTKPKPKPKTNNPPPSSKTAKGDKTQAGQDEGKVEASATSSGGTTLSGATVDNSSFTYGWWFDVAFQKIVNNFRFSYSYDGALICVVSFQVIQSGRILELKVKQSSGVTQYDDACLRAVQSSEPLPPLPRDFTAEIIGITLPFTQQPR